MNALVRPRNKWGWARIAGCLALLATAAWMIIAAALRGMGEIPWMAWSGYQAFSVLKGIEIAVILLLVVMVAGWLEEQDASAEVEQLNRRAEDHAAMIERKAILKSIHEAVNAILPDTTHGGQPRSDVDRMKLGETIRGALPGLDGKGRGELLHFLFEKGMLSGDTSIFDAQDADFSGVELHKPHLNMVDLSGANLEKAQIDGAHMAHSRLSGINLSRALLRHADLTNADLSGSDLTKAHLEGANLEGANLAGACLNGAFLMNANLRDSTFVETSEGSEGHPDPQHDLERAILIDTRLPDGRKVTNERGREHQHKKEMAYLIDRL